MPYLPRVSQVSPKIPKMAIRGSYEAALRKGVTTAGTNKTSWTSSQYEHDDSSYQPDLTFQSSLFLFSFMTSCAYVSAKLPVGPLGGLASRSRTFSVDQAICSVKEKCNKISEEILVILHSKQKNDIVAVSRIIEEIMMGVFCKWAVLYRNY